MPPGRRDWVEPMSLAAAAAGADGIIVEVHNDPEEAICDGPQALPTRRASPTTPSELRAVAGDRRQGASRRSRPERPGSPAPMKLAVLGVGLIGGSIGLAARRAARRRGRRLRSAIAANARARRSRSGRSTAAAGSVAEAVAGADVVFCAAPVSALPALVAEALRGERARDRGHRRRLDQARAGRGGRRARRSRRASSAAIRSPAPRRPGSSNSRADLFEGARWYLTPTERSEGVLFDRLHSLDRRDRRPAAGDRRRPSTTGRWRRSATCRTCSPTCSSSRAAETPRPAASGAPRSAAASATRPASPAPTRRSGPTSSPPTPSAVADEIDAVDRAPRRGLGAAARRPIRERLARLAGRPPHEDRRRAARAGGARRRRSCSSCGSRSRTGPASSPRSRWRWAAPASTSRT